MKIAVLADPVDNQKAGIHTFTMHLVSGLIKHRGGHEIIIIKEKKTGTFSPCKEIAIPNIKAPIGFASIRLFLIIPLILRLLKVDVVIEPTHFGPFNLPERVKRITIVHDLTAIILPKYHRWFGRILQKLFLPGILRKTDHIVTNSSYTSSDVVKYFPKEKHKVKTLLLGKDTYFRPEESDSEIVKVTGGRPFFHYLGTIEPRKSLSTLLRSYEMLRDKHPSKSPMLLIAGRKGWKTKPFYNTLNTNRYRSDIKLLGHVSKKMARQLHSHSLSLVYPSIYEGFGLPILECFSCGGNVIVSRNTSLPEVGGPLAQYFRTRDSKSLMEKMLYALNQESNIDDRRKAVQWSDQFSWDTYITTLYKLIEAKD